MAERTVCSVGANRQTFDAVVDAAVAECEHGRLEQAMCAAAIAATFAWFRPTGALYDVRLESLLVDVASALAPTPVDRRPGPGERRVLHVLTEAYETGGHTRLAARWATRDRLGADFCLTNQRGPIPHSLLDAAAERGGVVHDLKTEAPSLVHRAKHLHRLMAEAEVVVLHIHPFDTVAVVAAHLGRRAKVVFENHADHCFWVGLAAADVVMNHRAVGEEVCKTLRTIPEDRLAMLPLPIDAPNAGGHRAEARRRWGIADDDVLALSVAAEHKMQPVWGRGFDAVLNPALDQHPSLKVWLVGSENRTGWDSSVERHPERVRHLGKMSDLTDLFDAADIYLDSYPASSGTSILEAAAHGLPLVSFDHHDGLDAVYGANSPGLVGTDHEVSTREDYLARVGVLVDDADERATQGERARRLVSRTHDRGETWSRQLADLYERTSTVSFVAPSDYSEAPIDDSYAVTLSAFMRASAGPDLDLVNGQGFADRTSISTALRLDRLVPRAAGAPNRVLVTAAVRLQSRTRRMLARLRGGDDR